jgi:hypothetical protein
MKQNASQFAKTIIFDTSIESVLHQMSLVNDDETNSIAKIKCLQDFSERDIEQRKFRTR